MILLVDDDPLFLRRAQHELDFGEGILFAINAEQARHLMATIRHRFDVAVIDLDLRGEDGFSLIREMRERYPHLPVIAISGILQKHVLESAELIGAAAVLPKPISPEWHTVIERVRHSAGAE